MRQADVFLRGRGTSIEAATRADLEAFMGDLLARRAPATAATYYKVLKILYACLAEEEEIPADPMARMKRPIVPDKPVPIVAEDGLKRLLRACAGNTFEARRDTALLMLLLDTGARRAEMGSERHLQACADRRPAWAKLPFDWPGRPMSTVSLSRVAPCRVEAHQMPSLRMNSSMLTSLKVTTRTLVTKRAGRYMSHTQASCRVMSK